MMHVVIVFFTYNLPHNKKKSKIKQIKKQPSLLSEDTQENEKEFSKSEELIKPAEYVFHNLTSFNGKYSNIITWKDDIIYYVGANNIISTNVATSYICYKF